jgi:hypothetical protein
MPTVFNTGAEARWLSVCYVRLAGLVVPRCSGGDIEPDGGCEAILWCVASSDVACRSTGTAGPLSETRTGCAQHVRCAVHGEIVDRADMDDVDARAETARRPGLWPLYHRHLRDPVR